MIAVVDTSAVIRLFIDDGPIPDGLEAFLLEIQRGNAIGLAPELMWAEAANVLLKKRALGELTDSQADELLSEITRLPFRPESHIEILPRAFEIAVAESLSVYDSLFLSLAEIRSGVIFTADQQLTKAAKKLHLLP